MSYLYGIEHLTKDAQGYIYWKRKNIEHYSYHDKEHEKLAAENLASDCKLLESENIEINQENLSKLWQKRDMDKFPPKVRMAAEHICTAYGINGICDPGYIANIISNVLR